MIIHINKNFKLYNLFYWPDNLEEKIVTKLPTITFHKSEAKQGDKVYFKFKNGYISNAVISKIEAPKWKKYKHKEEEYMSDPVFEIYVTRDTFKFDKMKEVTPLIMTSIEEDLKQSYLGENNLKKLKEMKMFYTYKQQEFSL